MNRFLALFGALVLAVATAQPAAAQAFGDAPGFAPAKFGANNPHLKALLDLQYQMQVLKRLIEREKAVNAMVQSAVAIGVKDPFIPKPDEELCAQVPANIPCAQAYKDMYPGFDAQPFVPDVAPPLANIASAIPSLTNDALPSLPSTNLAMPSEGATLYWTNVTCLAEKCSAIITPDPRDPRARYRVIMGDKLADGATVSSISANGVTIDNGKKSVVLDPAPKA